MDWLGGHMAPDSPSCQVVVSLLHPTCRDQDSGRPWPEQRLRKRPEALNLPRDAAAIAQPPTDGSSGGSQAQHGVRTPQRELSVAMRAAAIASEQHSPRTATLKLAAYELAILDKAPATSRMQQTAWLRDAEQVVAHAERVAQIATRAQSAKATPTRIQAELRSSQLLRFKGRSDDARISLASTLEVADDV